MAGEVAKEVLTGLSAVVEKLGLDRAEILDPVLDENGSCPERADFAAALEVYARLEAALPPGELPRSRTLTARFRPGSG